MMGRINALILAAEAVFMIPPLVLALVDGVYGTFRGFLYGILILLAVSGVLFLLSRGAQKGFYAREGLICVGVCWVIMSLLGCLPFWLSGEIPHYVDALFEMVSGFTTTGATIVGDVEALSRATLYWRSFSHWVGGMGVLVFLLAVIPVGGQNKGFTMHLMRAESPGPDVGKLVPKMRQTAAVLYLTYVALTLLNFVFLLFGGMPVFDAVCTAFGTAGTGGFGIKNDSMASYSPYLQGVCTVFMLLFGVNFSCYYLLLLRKVRSVLRDEELRLYLGVVATSTLLIAVNLWRSVAQFAGSFGTALHHAAFQVSSIITTTGFSTASINDWPAFSQAILLGLMVIGACAGSTGGGIKCARVLLLCKGLHRNLAQLIRPREVRLIRVSGKTVDEKVMANTNAYLCAYVVILLVSTVVVSLDGLSFLANFSAVLSCFNNIGPGFAEAASNFSCFGPLSKVVLILDMLAGRLEIFPILVLLSPSVWRSR